MLSLSKEQVIAAAIGCTGLALVGCQNESGIPPKPIGPRPLVHLVDELGEQPEMTGELADLELPRMLQVSPQTLQPWAGRDGVFCVSLPWPVSPGSVQVLDSEAQELALGSKQELLEGTADVAWIARRRTVSAQDFEYPKGHGWTTRPSVHSVATLMLEHEGFAEMDVGFTDDHGILRVQAKNIALAEGAVTLRISVDGESHDVTLTRELQTWDIPVDGGPKVAKVHVSVEMEPPPPGRDPVNREPVRIVQIHSFEVLEDAFDQLLIAHPEPRSLVVRYVPSLPQGNDVLAPWNETSRYPLFHLGGAATVNVKGLLQQAHYHGQPLVIETGAETQSLELPLGEYGFAELELVGQVEEIELVQHRAALLQRLLNADSRLRDDLNVQHAPGSLADRVLSRIACGADRRASFWLPAPATLDVPVTVFAGDRLRLALGVADQMEGSAASSTVEAARRRSQQEKNPVRFTVQFVTEDGTDTLFEETVSSLKWQDRELTFQQPRRGTLRFITEGPVGTPAAIGDPRLVPMDSERIQPPNVIFYLIDTLRTDGLGCYGSRNPTSPAIDAFAANSFLFENFYAVASWTRPTTATMMTGLLPTDHKIMADNKALPFAVVTLAETLRSEGYSTWAGTTNIQVSAPGVHFEQGFHRFVAPQALGIQDPQNQVEPASTLLNNTMLPWLEANGDEPFFLYLHSMDPHTPYLPKKYAGEFTADYDGPLQGIPLFSVIDIYRHIKQLGDADFDYVENVYHEEIREQDDEFRRLLEFVEEHGLAENTIVILLSDHGEEFYEHRGFFHAGKVWQEQLQVPLIVSLPSKMTDQLELTPRRILTPVSQLDILPSLLDLVGLELSSPQQGTSFVPLLYEESTGDPLIYGAETEDLGYIVRGDHKYLWRILPPPNEGPIEQLFRLSEDPTEQVDLAETQASILSRMKVLRKGLEEQLKGNVPQIASEDMNLDADTRRMLEQLGYINSEEN